MRNETVEVGLTSLVFFILLITDGQKKIMKQVIEAVDPDKKLIKWKVIRRYIRIV